MRQSWSISWTCWGRRFLVPVRYVVSRREHTAIPDYLTEACILEERVQSRYGRVQALRRKVDRIANGAALLYLALSAEA
jgi:hypothetical protein